MPESPSSGVASTFEDCVAPGAASVALTPVPFSAAVTTAAPENRLDAVTEKLTLKAFVANVTVAGTLRAALLDDTVTIVDAAAGAASTA